MVPSWSIEGNRNLVKWSKFELFLMNLLSDSHSLKLGCRNEHLHVFLNLWSAICKIIVFLKISLIAWFFFWPSLISPAKLWGFVSLPGRGSSCSPTCCAVVVTDPRGLACRQKWRRVVQERGVGALAAFLHFSFPSELPYTLIFHHWPHLTFARIVCAHPSQGPREPVSPERYWGATLPSGAAPGSVPWSVCHSADTASHHDGFWPHWFN